MRRAWWLAPLGVVLAVACAPRARELEAQVAGRYAPTELRIELFRPGRYRIEIEGDGRVRYQAEDRDRVFAPREDSIPVARVARLLDQFLHARFFDLPDPSKGLTAEWVDGAIVVERLGHKLCDGAPTVVSLRLGDADRQLWSDTTPELRALTDSIEAAVQIVRWVDRYQLPRK